MLTANDEISDNSEVSDLSNSFTSLERVAMVARARTCVNYVCHQRGALTGGRVLLGTI